MIYKLIDFITVPQTIFPLAATVKYGDREVIKYDSYIRLEPGKTYETDDPVLANSLKKYLVEQRYNTNLDKALKECGADYKVEKCKSCGGKIRKIKYHPVEVKDE